MPAWETTTRGAPAWRRAACLERDIDLWVYAGRTDWTPAEWRNGRCTSWSTLGVDGIVVAAGCIASTLRLSRYSTASDGTARCPCARRPVLPGVPSILVDNVSARPHRRPSGARPRCRRLAYVAGPPEHEESEQRLRERATHCAGTARPRPGRPLPWYFLAHTGREVVAELLQRRVPFDAIITANDDMAVGALEVLGSSGIGCPEQWRCGFRRRGPGPLQSARSDDHPATRRRLGPPPSPACGDVEGHGAPTCQELDTELVIRESCGCHPPPRRACSVSRARPPRSSPAHAAIRRPAERRRWSEELASRSGRMRGEAGALPAAFEAWSGRCRIPRADPRPAAGHNRAPPHAHARAGCPPPEDALHAARWWSAATPPAHQASNNCATNIC